MSRAHSSGDVTLECGHVLHFQIAIPHKKEILWCARCHAERGVSEVHRGQAYRIRCKTCNYTRGKEGKLLAERAMVAHRQKRGPHHSMEMLDSTNAIVWKLDANSEDRLELPEEAPF